MGATDLVPGVSGGTLALVMGIYYELVASLRALSGRTFLDAVRRFRPREAFEAVNGRFLVSLGLGMAAAIVTLAFVMSWLLEHRPVLVSAFFFGLVLASAIVVARQVRGWRGVHFMLFVGGALGAFVLVGLAPAVTPDAAWFLMLSGALAVSAFMLPGVSGAFMLLLLGKYEFALNALTSRDWVSVLLLVAGGLIGLLGFSRFLTWLFRKHHDVTLALMAGVVLGSLRKIWPWQADGDARLVTQWPATPAFDATSGWFWCLLLMLAGFILVLFMERLGSRSAE